MDQTVTLRLDQAKFQDPLTTAKGEARAQVPLKSLETLWFNTGTLCNLACGNCYIESSPKNDRLVYLSAAEVAIFLDEIAREGMTTRQIGFTGGEPFMNPDFMTMLEDTLSRGFEVLVLTNAMRPMMKCEKALLALGRRYGGKLVLRVSVDHYTKRLHEAERGPRSWAPAIMGLQWLAANDFTIDVAGRLFSGETEYQVRSGFAGLFESLGLPVDAWDRWRLVLFPEMDASMDVPEVTEGCWGILNVSPDSVMCAGSRMVVKRKGDDAPLLVSCTLLPYDSQFEMGRTLKEALGTVSLNHPHCARFCVLGGAACSG